MQRRRLRAAVILLTLCGVGMMLSGIFPEDPDHPTDGAGIIHWVGGFLGGFGSPIAAFFIVGRQLRKHPGWLRYGLYSTLTAWVALALIPAQYLFFLRARRWPPTSAASWSGCSRSWCSLVRGAGMATVDRGRGPRRRGLGPGATRRIA